MKAAIVHRYFWPQNYPYAVMLKYHAEGLRAAGHSVEVISTSENSTDQYSERQAWADSLGISTSTLTMESERHYSVLQKLLAALRYAIWVFVKVVRSDANVVIVGTTPPVLMPLILRIAKCFRRFEYVYHCQDVHPEALLINGNVKKGVIYRILRSIDRGNVASAKAVVTLSSDMAATLRARRGFSGNVKIVNNFVLATSVGISPIKNTSVPTFLFAGTLGRFQNLQFLTSVAIKLSLEQGYRFVFLGDGIEREAMEQMVSAAGAEGVTFLGHQKLDVAVAAMSVADFGLVCLTPGVDQVAYPSKTIMYLSQGLPVVAFVDPKSSLGALLNDNRFGLAISPDDIDRAASSIATLVADRDLRCASRGEIQLYCEQNFSEKAVVKNFVEVVCSE